MLVKMAYKKRARGGGGRDWSIEAVQAAIAGVVAQARQVESRTCRPGSEEHLGRMERHARDWSNTLWRDGK
jgi:hypothetical protein